MVWTNDDGDIDALPWDMGGWSTGSSAQQAASGEEAAAADSQQQQQERLQRQQADPVDEDALIGALRRKVVRLPDWGGMRERLAGWLVGGTAGSSTQQLRASSALAALR
jgi:hypothetical protein